MNKHQVGDLLLHKAPTLRNTLGYIKKIKKGYREYEYEVYWFNPYLQYQDDISLESHASINSFKRNLQEYMDEHRTQSR
jgi:hypothetical protein